MDLVLAALKEEMHLSVSAIYKEALESYHRQKEIEKWEQGAKLAAEDEEYMAFVNEMSNDAGDIIPATSGYHKNI